MARAFDDSLVLQQCVDEDRAAALDLVLRDLSRESRAALIASVEAESSHLANPWEGLWVARRCLHITGAVWAQFQVGRTAAIWPPRLVESEPEPTASKLLETAADEVGRRGVRLAQALLEMDHGLDSERLRASGFRHTSDLLYLVSLSASFPDVLPQCDLEFLPYEEQYAERLAKIVEGTYEGTRDCPELNDVRETGDVLAGYRATGTFDPAHWLLVRHGGRDIGCLLLADHPRSGQMELVYMGLRPDARGHGWGVEIVRRAQWLTWLAGRARLVLAVDADNSPAIAVYAAAGFVAWDRRSVFLRIW